MILTHREIQLNGIGKILDDEVKFIHVKFIKRFDVLGSVFVYKLVNDEFMRLFLIHDKGMLFYPDNCYVIGVDNKFYIKSVVYNTTRRERIKNERINF